MTKSRPLFFHFQFEMIYKLINQTISKDKYVFFFFFFVLFFVFSPSPRFSEL